MKSAFLRINKKFMLLFSLALSLFILYGCQPDYPELRLSPPENEEDVVTAPTPHYEPQEEASPEDEPYLRITVAPVISSPQSRESYRTLLSYLPEQLEQPAEMILRSSHGEVVQLLQQNLVDVALLCPSSYMEIRETGDYEILAVPQIKGETFYQSYIIAARGSGIKGLEDLKGETFVFTDPLSLSGGLYPFHMLEEKGEDPDVFFADYFYSYNPDNSVLAVAEEWIGGAAINNLVFEYLVDENPEFGERLKIVESSSPGGYVPLVVNTELSEECRDRLQETLLQMHKTPEGQEALSELRIERFYPPEEFEYDAFDDLMDKMDMMEVR